jgi:ABC-type lipoprotein export system ATPase subunit
MRAACIPMLIRVNDGSAGANVQNILRDLAHRHGRAAIVVTHDRDFAAAADRVIEMSDARIVRGGR